MSIELVTKGHRIGKVCTEFHNHRNFHERAYVLHDVDVHLLEIPRLPVPRCAKAHYIEFQCVCTCLLDGLGELFPFSVSVAGYGSDDRNRHTALGCPDEIHIVLKSAGSHIGADVVVCLRMFV